jgi:microcystin-dependent protein
MGISLRRSREFGSASFVTPAGIVSAFAGPTAPEGWLLCFGQEIAIASFPDLYAVLGTVYGSLTNGSGGAGSTHFRVPDMRGRAVAGEDDMGGTAANRLTTAGSGINGIALGATGGSQTHTLTSAQMPSHTHTQDAHGHVISSNSFAGDLQIVVGPRGGDGAFYSLNDSGSDANVAAAVIYARNTTATNQNTGGGGAHTNTQPTIILNYIIKA